MFDRGFMSPSQLTREPRTGLTVVPPVVPRDLELLDLVDRNEWTEVWQARQRETGHFLCWKGLRERSSDQPQANRRFEHERRVLLDVSSPYVVHLVEGPRAGDPPGLRLAWLPGDSLQRRLTRTPKLPVPSCIWIARQIAQGLEALLAAGWLHGALHPAHVRLAPNGAAVLVGLSQAVREELCPTHFDRETTSHQGPAPRGTGRLAHRREHDLQDLGRLLWRMLTGVPVGATESDPAALALTLRRQVPEIPRELAILTARLLTESAWPRGVGLRDVIRPIVSLELGGLDDDEIGNVPIETLGERHSAA